MEQSLRVTLLGEVYPFKGGTSQYNSNLANSLSKKAAIQVISFKRSFVSIEFPQQLESITKDFPNHGASFSLDILAPKTWKKTAEEIIKFKPNVLIMDWHWQRVFAYNYIIKQIRNLPCKVIVICHEPFTRRKLQKKFSELSLKKVLKKADICIVHSKSHQKIIQEIAPEANILKLFLPVNEVLYRSIDKKSAKRTLGIKGNVLLFFGYVREDKGLKYLISAVSRASKQISVTLLIVGEFSGNKEHYLTEIKKLNLTDKVRIVDGYVSNEEAATYFSAADILAVPYTADVPSAVISTAYAFGKPAISSNLPSLAEYVKDGKTGYIVTPKNSDSLANAIIRYFEKDRSNAFQKMINLQKTELSGEKYCEQLISAIKDL
jgi:glycosyltransferase involved in cell wall biosynthesis